MNFQFESSEQAEPARSPGISDPWVELSGHQGRKAFAAAWLGLTCSAEPSIKAGAAFLSLESGHPDEASAVWTREGHKTAAFLSEANRFMMECKLNFKETSPSSPFIESVGEGRSHVVAPLIVDGLFAGGLVVSAAIVSEQAGHRLMRHLQWSLGWLEAEILRGRVRAQAGLEDNAKAILEAISLVAMSHRYKDATRILAGYLASRFNASRVSVGYVKRGRSRLVSLSHTASFERSMRIARMIEEAMDEAVDLEQALLYTHLPKPHAVQAAALKRLAENRPSASILALPVAMGGDVTGAVVIEREGGSTFSQTDIDLSDSIVAAVAPMLEDKMERSRGLLSVLVQRMGGLLTFLLGPRALGGKLAILALIGGLVASVLLETELKVSANSVVEGKVRRILSAPFDGFIRVVAKGPGETVHQGDTLAELDDSDLSIQRLRLLSQKRQYVLELDKATATRDLAQSNILRAQIAQSDAELSLIEDKLERTIIKAPFNGVVVSGDLSQSIGKPVGRGDELYELAPLDHFRVTALVPESDVHLIKPGASASILFAALPEEAYAFEVNAVTLTARPTEGVNAFEIVAFLDDTTGRIRPGMEGVARIKVGKATYFRIWTRKIWHWAQLQLWAWWP